MPFRQNLKWLLNWDNERSSFQARVNQASPSELQALNTAAFRRTNVAGTHGILAAASIIPSKGFSIPIWAYKVYSCSVAEKKAEIIDDAMRRGGVGRSPRDVVRDVVAPVSLAVVSNMVGNLASDDLLEGGSEDEEEEMAKPYVGEAIGKAVEDTTDKKGLQPHVYGDSHRRL